MPLLVLLEEGQQFPEDPRDVAAIDLIDDEIVAHLRIRFRLATDRFEQPVAQDETQLAGDDLRTVPLDEVLVAVLGMERAHPDRRCAVGSAGACQFHSRPPRPIGLSCAGRAVENDLSLAFEDGLDPAGNPWEGVRSRRRPEEQCTARMPVQNLALDLQQVGRILPQLQDRRPQPFGRRHVPFVQR